ncbi:MAG: ECF transporter S component [Clostridia bacterium]|nr:ECF transporter S component [Clostridia bacterium]
MKKSSFFKYFLLLFAVPAAVALGAIIFRGKAYIFVSVCVAVFACVPFLLSFEKGRTRTKNLVVLATMVTLSIVGRFAFAFLPHFKPVTAIVVITGIYLGAENGFLCGALSALISNFIFGQGPWTPFQMLAWGLIGFFAAVLANTLKKSRFALSIYGAFSGALYSLLLDVFATLWHDGVFNPARYLALMLTALPVTAVYAASNIIFLLLLAKPIGEKLERIKTKYGL